MITKPKLNQLVYFSVNYNTISIEILVDIITHNSEHKIAIKKNRKEKKEKKTEKEKRAIHSQTAYLTILLKVFKNMYQLFWGRFSTLQFLTIIKIIFNE